MTTKKKLVLVTVHCRSGNVSAFAEGTIDEKGRASVPAHIIEGMLKALGAQDSCAFSIG